MSVDLRPMIPSDAEMLGSWASDPIFCDHTGWTRRSAVDGAIAWWHEAIATPDPDLIRLTVVRDDEPVGYVDLHGSAPDTRELGFVIGPSARWGNGLGSAAAHAGLAYGFEVIGLSVVWAEAVQSNTASMRILQKIGMNDAGPGCEEEFLGIMSRYSRFSLTRDEWSRGRR
ncbi:GNAT family protein [Planococcus sp. APC 4015]|nr:GNAT family protein [Planococcus sp. APC 4015]